MCSVRKGIKVLLDSLLHPCPGVLLQSPGSSALQSLSVRASLMSRSFGENVWDLFYCTNHGELHGTIARLEISTGMIGDLFGKSIAIRMSHDEIINP